MIYRVVLHRNIGKFFSKNHDKKLRESFKNAIYVIAQNPRQVKGFDVKKLQGYENDFRLRIGNYRFVYTVIDEDVVVFFFAADSRGGIYK